MSVMINGKEPKDVSFNELVDVVAGDALIQLIQGRQWRTIIYQVAQVVAAWSSERAKEPA